MGNSQAYTYAKPLPGTEADGQTAIYRSPEAVDGLYTTPKEFNSVGDVWKHNFKNYPDTPFLGYRPIINGNLQERYQFLNFREIERRARDLGSGILSMKLAPTRSEYKDYNLNMVAVYAKNIVEYVILDAACSLYGITTVPIYDTLGEEACEFMFKQTNLTTVFCTHNHYKGLEKSITSGNCGSLYNIVIMDEENWKEEMMPAEDAKYKAYTLSYVMKQGLQDTREYKTVGLEEIYTFSYTSGTTSEPKGAMMSHKNVLTMVQSTKPLAAINDELRYVSYLPLAHVYERIIMNYVLMVRGKYGIFGGDVFKLDQDLAILKPTIFASVPRLYNKFYDGIKKKMDGITGFKKTLLNKALNAKTENLRTKGKVTHALYDRLIFKPMKARLGGEVKLMLTASAPIDQNVLEF